MNEEYKGFTIRIEQDDDCGSESPRDWDNMGTMVCWHRRYNLGDNHAEATLTSDIASSPLCRKSWDDDKDWDDPADLIEMAQACGFLILPLYLYDHSGITMNTSGFSCGWDSGQVGIIYITPERARAEYSVKRLTKKVRAKVYDCLRAEVETYDDYLTGNVWGYTIDGLDDSCWGYYGDPETSGLLDNAKANIDYELRQRDEYTRNVAPFLPACAI